MKESKTSMLQQQVPFSIHSVTKMVISIQREKKKMSDFVEKTVVVIGSYFKISQSVLFLYVI